MHRLVQFALRKWIEVHDDFNSWRQIFLKSLSAEFPTGEYEHWSRCEILFPHAIVAATGQPTDEESLYDWSQILTNAAWYALTKGKYEVGENMVQKAIDVTKKILGGNDLRTIENIAIHAELLRYQGQYEAAEEINQRALEGRITLIR